MSFILKNIVLGIFTGDGSIDFKKLLIIATIGAFIIACIITAFQVRKELIAEEEKDKTKKNKKNKRL